MAKSRGGGGAEKPRKEKKKAGRKVFERDPVKALAALGIHHYDEAAALAMQKRVRTQFEYEREHGKSYPTWGIKRRRPRRKTPAPTSDFESPYVEMGGDDGEPPSPSPGATPPPKRARAQPTSERRANFYSNSEARRPGHVAVRIVSSQYRREQHLQEVEEALTRLRDFVREAVMLPKHIRCSTCGKQQLLDPLYVGYWPANPKKQSVLVEEKLLASLHELMMECPRETSIHGVCKALASYQQKMAHEPAARHINANMLGNAYLMYEAAIRAEGAAIQHLVDPTASERPGCPACHRHVRGLTYDCSFKCRHLASCSRGHQHPDTQPQGLFVDYPSVKPYVERRADGERRADCTSQFTVDNDCAKASPMYDYQAQGILVCRHYFVLGAVILRHGERYGYLLALLTILVTMWLRSGVLIGPICALWYDVACRFWEYALKHGDEELMKLFTFVTGKLHGPTHTLSCQLKSNGLYREHCGDSPGEQCEIVFSKTHRGYARAKYMTPMSYVLFYLRLYLHWNLTRAEDLARLLVAMGERAAEGKAEAVKQLPALYEKVRGLAGSTPAADTASDAAEEVAAVDLATALSEHKAAKDKLQELVNGGSSSSGTDPAVSPADIQYARDLATLLEEQGKISGAYARGDAVADSTKMREYQEKVDAHASKRGHAWDANSDEYRRACAAALSLDMAAQERKVAAKLTSLAHLNAQPVLSSGKETQKRAQARQRHHSAISKLYDEWLVLAGRKRLVEGDLSSPTYPAYKDIKDPNKPDTFPWEVSAGDVQVSVLKGYVDACEKVLRCDEEAVYLLDDARDSTMYYENREASIIDALRAREGDGSALAQGQALRLELELVRVRRLKGQMVSAQERLASLFGERGGSGADVEPSAAAGRGDVLGEGDVGADAEEFSEYEEDYDEDEAGEDVEDGEGDSGYSSDDVDAVDEPERAV